MAVSRLGWQPGKCDVALLELINTEKPAWSQLPEGAVRILFIISKNEEDEHTVKKEKTTNC